MVDKEKDVFGKNLKHLRKSRGLTQQELADKLEIRRSSIGAYEECRATPRYETLLDMSNLFEISVDMLIREDLTVYSYDDLRKKMESHKQDIEGRRIRVLTTPIEEDENKRIVPMIPDKAAAGYLNGLADPEYIRELPQFGLPSSLLGPGTYRAFEIEGDSMLPLRSGSIIICEFIENWRHLKDGKTYIVISNSQEGIVYKRLYSHINNDGGGKLILRSDNKAYDDIELPLEQVREIWQAKMFLSNEFPSPDPDMTLEKLSGMVMNLQEEVIRLRKSTP